MTRTDTAPAIAVRGSPIDCPHPEKRRYSTRAFAEAVAAAQTFRAGKPFWAYACDCGLYHLTSKPPREHRNRPSRKPLMNTTNGTGTLTDPLAPDAGSVLVWSSAQPQETYEELLDRASCGSARAREAAAHITGLLADLAEMMLRDAARLEREQRAAELRAEIAAKAAELKALEAGFDDGPAAPFAVGGEETPEGAGEYSTLFETGADVDESAPGGEDAPAGELFPPVEAGRAENERIQELAYDPEVKAWAKANGYVVPERGRVGNAIVRWYLAAQEKAAGVVGAEPEPAAAESAMPGAEAVDTESAEYAEGYASTSQIREWLTANGHLVAVRGRLSDALRQAYYDAHRGGGA